MGTPLTIAVKRIHEPADPGDGARFLVDRLWPRGVKKESLQLTEWDKDLSPSDELRHWFNHEPERWDEFRRRYAAELRQHVDRFESLRERARQGTLTLVYAAHNEQVNNAVAMREFLLNPDGLNAYP